MPTKKRYVSKRGQNRRYKRRTTRKYNKRTNLNWETILNAGKAVGGTLFNGAKLIGSAAGAIIPQLNMLPMALNSISGIKNALDYILGKDDDEDEQENAAHSIRRMKLAIIKLSKTMVSKYPRMREHPLYTEMSKLYDDLDFMDQFQSSWSKIEIQKQLYPLMQSFKQILIQYKNIMNQL